VSGFFLPVTMGRIATEKVDDGELVVHVWTVDEVHDMERLIALGVDCIITDYPDRLLRLVDRR